MSDRDAQESREATEQGKKNMKKQDLFESIQYDIRETSRFGSSSTRYKLNASDIEDFLDDTLAWLGDLEYSVSFEHPYLNISWESEQD